MVLTRDRVALDTEAVVSVLNPNPGNPFLAKVGEDFAEPTFVFKPGRASDVHEGFVDVVAFLESHSQSAKLMKQRQRLLDDSAQDAHAAALRLAPSCDGGGDAAAREDHASLLVVRRRAWFPAAGWRAGGTGAFIRAHDFTPPADWREPLRL